MRFKFIDSLRGIAASAVVFYHLWTRFYPGQTSQDQVISLPHGWAGALTLFLFGFGYFGVDLFFVLSGLCIHLPQATKFHATGSDRLKLGRFAKRRFWRLYPAYFASLVWTSLAFLPWLLAARLLHRTHFTILATLDLRAFASNALFLQQIFPRSLWFNKVYWTLLYELQFYFFYPLLLRVARRMGFTIPLLVLLFVEIILIVKPFPIPQFFLGRYYEWFLGMYLAERIASRRPIQLPAFTFPVLFVAAIASVFYSFSWPFRDVLASTAFAVLVVTCLQKEGSWKWLSHPRLVFVGVFSYSLYLTHIPMIELFWKSVGLVRGFIPSFPLWTVLLCIPACFVLGYAFYCWFEEPFLSETKKTKALAIGEREQAW